MTFYSAFSHSVLYFTLFTEIYDKPIIREACLEIFRMVCLDIVEKEAEKPERERGNDVSLSMELIDYHICDFMIDDNELNRQIIEEQMERIIHNKIWENVVRYLLQFLEEDEYTKIDFEFEAIQSMG